MTRVAVTGASGFIGRHVLAALSKVDADVVAHARTPKPEHEAAGRRRWTYFDLSEAFDDAFDRLGRPELIIHLAWEGLPNYLSPRHLETELPVQRRFLRGLITSGLRRLTVTGTCLEYGMQSGCLREDITPQPSNAYGIAKDALRRDLESLNETPPLDLRWLRLFYFFGGGQAPTSLYSQFQAAVARHEKQFNMSRGDQSRDFMRVEDAAEAIVGVALAPAAPRILNICSGAPTTVRAQVEQWRTQWSTDIALNLGALSYPAYEPFAFWGDDDRLRRVLGRS